MSLTISFDCDMCRGNGMVSCHEGHHVVNCPKCLGMGMIQVDFETFYKSIQEEEERKSNANDTVE